MLALRGRIRDVPWYSFFTWGWREPLDWARSCAAYEGSEYQAPTAMVDLAKPAFKLGVAALQVGLAEHELQVERDAPTSRSTASAQKALARIKVTQGGKPLAGAEVAFAAVDEGLLALRDNASWDLLDAMLQRARLGRGDQHRAERDHRPAPLRPQGGGGGRRRRARRHARAVRHAAAVAGRR